MKKNYCCWILILFLIGIFLPVIPPRDDNKVKHYRFQTTGNTISVVPTDTALTVETATDTFYYVNAGLDDIYKTDDKGVTNSRVYNGSNTITGMWFDTTNDFLYWAEATNVAGGDIVVKYLDLSNDTVTTIGTFNNGGGSDILASDICLAAGGTIFLTTITPFLVVVAHWGGAAWVIDDTQAQTDPQTIYSLVKVSDTRWYIGVHSHDPPAIVTMFSYDNPTTTIFKLDEIPGDEATQTGMAWDGSNIIQLIVKVVGVDKLVNYNISGDVLTQIATFAIVFQLDRFNSGTVPNEVEKAYGKTSKIIYEIKPRRGGIIQLQDMSGTLANNPVAITDNFLIGSGGLVYEWTDVSTKMTNLSYNGGCFPVQKIGSFRTHRDFNSYWNEKDSIKAYDDNDVLEIWAKITKKYIDIRGIYHYDFDFYSNEASRVPYNKTYSNDKTSEKFSDIIDNKFNFCYQSASIVATTIQYNYVYKRNTMYMFDLGRFLEREVIYPEPDAKIWSKAYDGLAKSAQHYPGTYDFKDGTITGWTDDDDADCTSFIVDTFDAHNKVLRMRDANAAGKAHIYTSITQGLNTEIEFYATKSSVAADTVFYMWLYEGATRIIYFYFVEDDIYYYDGAAKLIKAAVLTAGTLTHFRLVLNDTANTFDVYIDGVLEGDDLAYENNTTSGIDKIDLRTNDGDTGYSGYIDAIGISTDPTYTIGDNVVAWSLYDGNQNAQLIDIKEMAQDRGGYFKGSLGVTRQTVRYRDNSTITMPVAATRDPIEQLSGIIEAKEFSDAKLEALTEATQLATNRYNILTSDIQFIGLRVEGEGFLGEGKTLYLEGNQQTIIAAGHFLLLRYRRLPIQDITYMVLSDNIIFPREFTSFGDTTRLIIHAANVLSFENQADIIAHLTPEGGIALRLTNKTGVASVKGTLVQPHTNDNSFELTVGNCTECFGAVYEGGIADGAECLVVIGGRVQVLLKDATISTTKNWVKTSDVAGRADATGASPAAAPQHFQEVGHCIETKGADTDVLAFIMMHFL